MAMRDASYDDIRTLVLPGDVIAFLGDNVFSTTIKQTGKAGVSHLGVIVEAAAAGQQPRYAESTVEAHPNKPPTWGFDTTSFKDRVDSYKGAIWWLPLGPAARAAFDGARFDHFIDECRGVPFSISSGFNVIGKDLKDQLIPGEPLPMVRVELMKAYCCSEFVARALAKSRVVSPAHPGDASPSDVCQWEIYAPDYVRLKGSHSINGYNSAPPGTT